MITVKHIPNLLSNDHRKDVSVDFDRDWSIERYLQASGFDYDGMRFIVSGRSVDDLSKRIDNGDEILIVPHMEFDPGTWAAIVAVFKVITTVVTIASAVYSVYQAVTFKQPATPNFGSNGDGLDESSPTYGWDGVQTIQEVGTPVPIVYGEHIVGGNIINSFVNTDGDKNYLNVLLALCEGEIESISELKVNDNPSANFDGITTYQRLGTNADSVIANFGDLHNLIAQSQLLTQGNSYVYTTAGIDVEAFELHFTLLNGLYEQNQSSGALETWNVTYRVEYKLSTSGTYIDLGLTTISAKSRSAVRRIFRQEGLTPGQYDIRVTRTSEDTSTYKVGDLSLTNIDEIKTDDLAYPNTAKLGIKALATDQLSGSMPNFTCVVKGKKVNVPQVMFSAVEVPWEDYYWDPLGEVYKRFIDDGVCSWDGSTYVERWCANPVWCLKDLFLNSRYGLGEFIDTQSVDDGLFLEMSRYCEEVVADGEGGREKRFRMDVVIDSPSRVPDLLMQLAGIFRGLIFFSEGTVKTRIDKPDTPVQLFGMGNIIEGGFSQQWKSLRDTPNVIEVQYLDKDKNYQQEKVAVIDEVALANGEPMRKRFIRVFVTKTSYALREGRYALKVAKYIDRSVTLKCGIDALACQAGDVINVSHDVPQWGFSGRVKDGSINSVTLDQEFTVEIGKTYKVQVRFSDDMIEERTVTNSAGTHTILTASPEFTQNPQDYDVYVVGETDKVVKPFRVISMSINNNDEVEITAIEYDENIYDDSAVVIPDSNYSLLSTEIPVVRNLDLSERSVTLADGTIENLIDVYFDYPDDSGNANKFKASKIYLSDDGGNSYNLIGYTEGREYAISGNIQKGKTYYVKVVTVTFNGIEDSRSHSPTDSVFIVGKDVEPDQVSNFQFSWADVLTLVWSPNTEADLAGYEIRKNDLNFGVDDSDLIYRGLANQLVLKPETRTVGTYYIRAVNTSGKYSSFSASVTPVNELPSQPTNLSVDVFFNVARIWWDDVAGSDVSKYEIWRSQTGAWVGEEEQLESVSGRGAVIDGNKARGGDVDSATDNTLVSSSLIGLADDSLNGDLVIITSGVNQGEELQIIDFDGTTGTITVESNWTVNPEATDAFMIFDRFEIKVRGHDYYGVGSFSAPLVVTLEGLDENAIGDNIVTARKIYVACLSALTSNVGCLTAGTIQGVTFQTGAGGARTVFDSTMLRTYDASCNVMFEVCDGCVCASTLKLIDPNCSCCYSYLSSGQWYFHDELGNETPYVKRIDSGVACTGNKICLVGWCTQPQVMVGIHTLNSYDKNYSGQTQKWDVYHTTPAFYCNSASDYGYCFNVHASLSLSAQTGADQVIDVPFGTVAQTASGVCMSCVRMKFQYWCNPACQNYCYGSITYQVCYRVNGQTPWCQCQFSYIQPHGSIAQMQTTYDETVIMNFPCNACWDLMVCRQSLSWINSGFGSGSSQNLVCTRTAVGGTAVATLSCCLGWPNYCINQNVSNGITINFSGSNPANIYYTCIEYKWRSYSSNLDVGVCKYGPSNCACARAYGYLCAPQSSCTLDSRSSPLACVCAGTGFCVCDPAACVFDITGSKVLSNANQTNVCLRSSIAWAVYAASSSGYGCATGCAYVCFCCATLTQCYTVCSGAAGSCVYERFYSHRDTFGAQTILDPTGCLNWLAIGFF
jgi:predicted phage tail protein